MSDATGLSEKTQPVTKARLRCACCSLTFSIIAAGVAVAVAASPRPEVPPRRRAAAMPKVTSLAGVSSNKENFPPNARQKKSSVLAISQQDSDEEGARPSKKSKSSSSGRRAPERGQQQGITGLIADEEDNYHNQQRQHASSSHDMGYKKRAVNGTDHGVVAEETDSKSSSREKILEAKLALLTAERDRVQSQFDELRELRLTEPERIMQEWRKAAERRDAQAEEYVSRLKSQIKVLEARKDGGGAASSSSGDGAFHRGEVASREEETNDRLGKVEERRMREEIDQLKQELASANLALRNQRSGLANQVASGSAVGYGDEKAIRRLYEDLTGLFVSRVEPAINREKDHYRCFHAIFASEGYYNLEMKLEESESNLPTNEAHSDRQDLVYVPAMNPDRDAEIIASGRLPSYLTESLRFERSTAVRFMSTLHKRLDKGSKR